MRIIDSIFLFLLLIRIGDAFVFSCEEVKFKLVNTNVQYRSRYVCLVAEQGYSNNEQLKTIFFKSDKVSTSFDELLNAKCIEQPTDGSWSVVADVSFDLNCTQEFSLIFTSSTTNTVTIDPDAEKPASTVVLEGETLLVNPQTGIMMHKQACTGIGNVKIYTGAGTGEEEDCFWMKTMPCEDFPEWIVSFDDVITISMDAGIRLTVDLKSSQSGGKHTPVSPLDRMVVMSSGRSDNLQNYKQYTYVYFDFGEPVTTTTTCTCSFDNRYDNYVYAKTFTPPFPEQIRNFYNGTSSWSYPAINYLIQYRFDTMRPEDVWDSQDNFVCDIVASTSKTSYTSVTSTTSASPKTTPHSLTAGDSYCDCSMDKFGMPAGFDSTQIWLDLVIILDVTEEMGQLSLDEAIPLIEDLVGSDDGDVLSTDPTAQFYTRVGLIAMSDKPEVIYNLNMTKSDKVKVALKTGVGSIDVVAAFSAAQQMLNDGLTPDRASARQVIYYMTTGDPKFVSVTIDAFKEDGSIIIVNDFTESEVLEQPGLKALASPGYFSTSLQNNYWDSVQLFCKGGCYHTNPSGVSFSKAVSTCDGLGGGKIASIHDHDKGTFVNSVFKNANGKGDYYWIGYNKTDDGWAWQDQSTNPYENWDTANGEPSQNSVSKCAYVDETTAPDLFWGAGNCNAGFPAVCEFQPCSAGNKNC